MRKHSAHPIDLFEGGAASDFTNAQLSKIFHTEPMAYLTTEGNKIQYLKYAGTFNYGDKPSIPAKFKDPAPTHGGVKNDFPMTADSMNVGYLTTDGNMADIYKMTARNIVDPEKAVVFQKPPKIEELKEEFGNLEDLIKRSLTEKEAARADLLRTALLTMGLTPEEVRKAEVDQRIAEVMRARATGRLGSLMEFPPAPVARVADIAAMREIEGVAQSKDDEVMAMPARGGAGVGAVPGGSVFVPVGDGTGAGIADKDIFAAGAPMGGAGEPMGGAGAPMGGAGYGAGRPRELPEMTESQRKVYDREMARLRNREPGMLKSEKRTLALAKVFGR